MACAKQNTSNPVYESIFFDFVHKVTSSDPVLCESIIELYHAIMEGANDATSSDVADALRNKVGHNPYEATGDNIYGKATDAGLDDSNTRTDRTLDNAVDQAIANNQFSDMGTALATESGLPTEDDLGMGLGDSPSDGNDALPPENPDDGSELDNSEDDGDVFSLDEEEPDDGENSEELPADGGLDL